MAKTARSVSLSTPARNSKFLNTQINRCIRDEITCEKIRALAYAITVNLKCLETSDLVKRIEALEQQILKKRRS